MSTMKSIMQGVVVLVVALVGIVALVSIVPLFLMWLWNDLAPVFGIGFKFTWFQMFELVLLINLIKLILKTDIKVVIKDVQNKLK